MPRKQKVPGNIAAAREHLLKSGPLSTTDLSRALGFVPGAFGRQLSTFGEELGLKKWTEVRDRRTVWVWDADPNWTPPKACPDENPVTPKPPKISRDEAAARAAEGRISELLRRFRQEPPRYAGRRRNG